MAGQCQLEREGLEAASRYQEGLIQRNVDKQSAAYRESVERVRAAGAKLQQCKEDAASD